MAPFNTRQRVVLFISVAISLPPSAWASDFATEVIEYVQGIGVSFDSITGMPFNDPMTALGRPTVDTTGDGWDTGAPTAAVPVVIVNAAFRSTEIVTIGEGGQLVLKFDHPVQNDPRNPCGKDFIVFGNTFQLVGGGAMWNNGNPQSTRVSSNILTSEPGIVSVSQDGTAWYALTTPHADEFAPTLGRVFDMTHPDSSLGTWNLWWSQPTCPLIPPNPALNADCFLNLTVAECAQKYGFSAGGTSFDLTDVGLDWIQYVKIENPTGSGFTPEIDAVADVDPDAAAPDFDCDADVDAADLNAWKTCRTGSHLTSITVGCERADIDADGDVDQEDFGLLQRCLSGSDVPADPNCKN